MVLGDSNEIMKSILSPKSVDLVVTSPPYALIGKKEYGNPSESEYLEWFRPFADGFKKVLKPQGSLVINIGGCWMKGLPTRSLYHFKLLLMLVEEYGFHLAQEFYWWNPAKPPGPPPWVTRGKIRVKDAIECVWWLSPSSNPKADIRPVLLPCRTVIKASIKVPGPLRKHPSGHNVDWSFRKEHTTSIPSNLIAQANTNSNCGYLRYCREKGIKPHPARFPPQLPEFFIRMLTHPGDLVFDPFGGSCVTGEVCERLRRRWLCAESREDYLRGAVGRFPPLPVKHPDLTTGYYQIPKPGLLWGQADGFQNIEPVTIPRDFPQFDSSDIVDTYIHHV